MDILLIRPPSQRPTVTPPIGLGYLATALERSGNRVNILDCARDRITSSELGRYIKKYDPDIVGFKLFSCDLNSVKESIETIKRIDKSIITVVGGPHPSAIPRLTMNFLRRVDFGFKGEAEVGFPKLVNRLESNETIEDVDGLIWRKDEKIIVNKQNFPKNLDELGFPKWDLIPPSEYPRAPHGGFIKNFPVAPIITSRGCPYRCTFCAAHEVTGRKGRAQ